MPVASTEKLFALPKAEAFDGIPTLVLRRFYVNPMPDTCSASGWKGAPFVLLFVPYVLASLFGLRVFHMLAHCESFRANLKRTYKNEIVESEVDYWQPSPWDRKVPKTRILCWHKMRRPLEPFYTWWRHENYFTWIFFPYRNERLARSERGIIIFCSLYITFYVTFLLAMVHSALGDSLPTIPVVVIYWFLLLVLPSLGKTIFKEMFKLIFRHRRKFFRLKAAGGDTSGFSFRLAFLLQVVVVLFMTLAQGPLLYIWLSRSCTFLTEFMAFGVLATVARLSVVGLIMDFAWYTVLWIYGHRDLCPHCTERLVNCDCFNDDLLILAVERVGAKWPLIQLLDDVLSHYPGHEPQFSAYTPEQLYERWHTLVDRAETHLERVAKLRAYRLQHNANRQSRFSRLRASFRSRAVIEVTTTDDVTDDIDSRRERRIVALADKLQHGAFEAPNHAAVVGVVHSIQNAVDGDAATSTPAQRLAEREDERARCDRTFSVLRGYLIEKRPTESALPSHKPMGPLCEHGKLQDARELLMPEIGDQAHASSETQT